MRIQFGLSVVAAALFAGAVLGQTATSPSQAAPSTSAGLTFDVASVRPAAAIDQATMLAGLRAGKRPQWMRVEGSRATYTYMSLKELVADAYKVRPYQVSGPEWLTTDRFDIAAKLPDGASRDDVPAMLQALLVERFKLAAHRETKEHPVLGLVVKGAPKLQTAPALQAIDMDAPLKPGESKIDSIDGPMLLSRNPNGSTTYNMGARGKFTMLVDGQTGTMHMQADGMTLKGFANMLSSLGGGNGRQVVDQTGLTGNYELAVDFSLSDLVSSLRDQGIDIPTGPRGSASPDGSASDPAGDSTVSDALGKLGLKLEKSKAMVEQLVIDHVEKMPTEN
ncbi:MAG TPA: TIGR03435 family protein [Acidobacteriaceae bacterium]